MQRVGELVRHPAARDWALSVAIIVIGLVDIAQHPHSTNYPGPVAANIAFLVASALPLAFRRLWPAWVAPLAIAAVTAWDVALYPVKNQASFEAFLVMLAAAYILGADLRGRQQAVLTSLVAVGILPGWLLSVGAGQAPGDVFPALTFTILAWVVGFTLRRRKQQARIERERADRLAFEQGRMAAEAVIEERSRIARELHDVVAHSLSLMVVQASAERRALRAGNGDIDSTGQVLESVETTGRDALVELRRLLGLVRRSDEAASRSPQPSLRHLDVLVDQLSGSGAMVEVEVDGEIADLPAGIDLTAYRIVQESLTNALKHAAASRIRVCLQRQHAGLDIEITDDGLGGVGSLPPGGHGLLGMRERVAVYGGSIDVGPLDPGPGFRVHVRLPVGGAVTAQR